MNTGEGRGEGLRLRANIFGHENAIKHEKGALLDFLTTPSTPSKEFGQTPRTPFP
jgi:hypothetical protein